MHPFEARGLTQPDCWSEEPLCANSSGATFSGSRSEVACNVCSSLEDHSVNVDRPQTKKLGTHFSSVSKPTGILISFLTFLKILNN